MAKKVVLAYSGGLDTSVIIKWLAKKGYDVVAYMADIGQESDFAVYKKRALKTGATKVVIEDLKKEFVKDFVFKSLKAGAVYVVVCRPKMEAPRPLKAVEEIISS